MSAPSLPDFFTIPFADSGSKNVIPVASAAPLASLTDGFPPDTMQPLESGGVPPAGEDFNGILNWITKWLAYTGAGGRAPFNAALSTAMGGYSAGMVVQSDDGASEYVSLIDSNTHDPNTSSNVGPYWAPYSGAAACNGMYAIDTGTVNAYIIALKPPVTANAAGRRVSFKAIVSNTGPSTLNIGGGVTNIRRNDGSAMVSGDILAGSIYDCVYDTTSNTFIMTTPVISQYAPLYAPEVPVGTVLPYASSAAPSGYLLCNGAAVSRTTYASLYSIIGTLYGIGDNSTTFNVPDMRGRVALGAGQGAALENRVLATTVGEEEHTLTIGELPAHTHATTVIAGSGVIDNGGYYGVLSSATGSAGGSEAHNTMQPSLVLSFIIKT